MSTLFNYGLFESGLTLVGTFAFGAICHDLGIRVELTKTEDVDMARLNFDQPEGVSSSLHERLSNQGDLQCGYGTG